MDEKWREWKHSILLPLLNYSTDQESSPVLRALLERNDVDLALLAADTDRTQDYVFESAKLPEIRGGSRQLDDSNQLIGNMVRNEIGCDVNKTDEDCVIYADGGGLLALVPAEVAKKLVLEIEALYLRRTTTATITADWRPVTPAMVIESGYPRNTEAPFAGLVGWANTWLKRRKESRTMTPFIEALPYAERCRSCMLRPANPAFQSTYPDWPLCSVCHTKRAYRGRDMWFRWFQKYLDDTPQERRQYYGNQKPFPRLDRDEEPEVRWTPQDLSEIGAACRTRSGGYVGFIYLDGDEMGRAFEQIPTPQAYKHLSQAITKAAQEAVMSALANLLQPAWVQPSPARQDIQPPANSQLDEQGRIRLHPFEIITIGGDDLMLITPADVALPIAATISQGFQNKLSQVLAKTKLSDNVETFPYTMSGGVVLASDHNPIRVLRDLAQELKGQAKKARKLAGATEGYLDFLVLKSADMLDRSVEQTRQLYPYHIEIPGIEPIRLLGGPYKASTLTDLWQTLGQLQAAGFPTSQMRLLAEALLRGRQEASLFYLYQQARGNKEQFKHLNRALEIAQGGSDPKTHPTPWFDLTAKNSNEMQTVQYSYQTALWDIAELYDFVPAEGGR